MDLGISWTIFFVAEYVIMSVFIGLWLLRKESDWAKQSYGNLIGYTLMWPFILGANALSKELPSRKKKYTEKDPKP